MREEAYCACDTLGSAEMCHHQKIILLTLRAFDFGFAAGACGVALGTLKLRIRIESGCAACQALQVDPICELRIKLGAALGA